ncbi:MAG TPA: Ig-like domain-containing protein [Acidobacteriota bacterium]
MSRPAGITRCVLLSSALLWCAPLEAVIAPQQDRTREALQYRHPDLQIRNVYQRPDRVPGQRSEQRDAELELLGVAQDSAFYDLRGGRWGTLVLSTPMIPGPANQGRLSWADLGRSAPAGDAELGAGAWSALRQYLTAYRAELGIDPVQLSDDPGISVHEGGRVIQIHGRREVGGIPVRDSYISAVINSGNLVLFGSRNWGSVEVELEPGIAAAAAEAAVRAYVETGFSLSGFRAPAELAIVPLAVGAEPSSAPLGAGYTYRLVWVLSPTVSEDRGRWEALVDAASGELLAFTDLNLYYDRKLRGGIYPVSNDGQPPDGVEQPGYPIPFADAIQPFGTSLFSNSSGLVDDVGGLLRTTLSGQYVNINDNCGPIDEVLECSDLDLGSGPGTDCDVPPGHSAGDTHSARSGFYELNRQIEGARALLPGNPWLHDQLTANMNIDDTCNAFWDGLTVNFFKSGAGCGNTGEIAAVFDHEWGHGLDDNDTDGEISSPGEAIADIYGILRVVDSCFGRGFVPGDLSCAGGGYGDPCLGCTGVRDLDFAKHQSGQPHDIDWILSPTVAPGGGCVGVAGLQQGPCGQETHCEGMVPAEAGWDLFARDLQSAPFNSDLNTGLQIATRLFYLSAGNIGSWYQCAPGPAQLAGCVADGGYLNLLAVDDDNGDLSDGTPHMQAIFNAFDRHQIACATPAVQNSGCAGAPALAPSLTVTALPQAAHLSWTAVPGATKYWVFRTEGVKGCDFGKVRIAETTATEYSDSGLLDGFELLYSVMPVGAHDSCAGPMSACVATVPAPKPAEVEDLLAFRQVPNALAILTGDDDPFLDNCEIAKFSFEVENAGSVDLQSVAIVSITPVSHPQTEILTSLPAPLASSLAGGSCAAPESLAAASFQFVPHGVGFDETMVFEVVIQGSSAAFGTTTLVGTIELSGTESDFMFFDSVTFDFEDGLQGWRFASGSYIRQSPGANGTLFHLASSSFQAGQCDEIQSPEIRLTPTSTLSLFNMFVTEPGTPLGVYDRANVGLFDVEAGSRITVAPDSGRLYNVSGSGGVCVTAGQAGWAGPGPGFLESGWSPTALQTSSFTGRRLRIDVAYGTDPAVEATGLQFDEVTLTDFELQVPDAQSDTCETTPQIQANDDAASTPSGSPVTIDVVANDFTLNPPLTVTAVTDPPDGSVIDNGDGTLTYSPDPGFVGVDSFDYSISDALGNSDSATVTVTVTQPAACAEPGATVLTDGGGDASTAQPEHDVLSLSIAQPTALNGDKFVFTLKMAGLANPTPNTTWPVIFRTPDGVDRFVKMATSATGTVSFAHGLGTNPSVAGSPADPASGFNADGTIRIVVPASQLGSPIPGQQLSQFLTRIRVELGPGGAVTPDNMPDSLTRSGSYGVTDCGSNQPPAAQDDSAVTEVGAAVTIEVLANDSDPNGDPLTVVSVTDPAQGSAAINPDGTITYTPDPGLLGSDGFEYTVCDPAGLCDTASVAVEVQCPATADGSFSDDFEPEPEAGWTTETAANNLPSLTWQTVTDPLTQSPTQAYFSDATTLDLKDDRLIAPPQDLSSGSHLIFWHRFFFEPTFDGGVLEVSTDGGSSWVDVLAGGGSFVEGGYNDSIDPGAGSPIAGRLAWSGFSEFIDAMNRVEVDLGAFAGLNVRVRWRLAADPVAPGSIPGSGWWIDDVQFTNTLVIPSDCPVPPRAMDDDAATDEDTPVVIGLLANDSDANGDPLTVTEVTAPMHGTVVNNGDGTVTYTPAPDFFSPPDDSFQYTVCDPGGLCAQASVHVTVNPVNDAPVANDDSATTPQDTPVTVDVLGNDSDPEGDSLAVVSVSDPPHGTAVNNGDGTVTYTPDPGFFSPPDDSFEYTVSDGGLTDTATVTVTVTQGQSNQAPVANDDSATTPQDTPVTVDVLANDSDPDGDSLTVTGVSDPANGSAVSNGDGTVTYTPDAGFVGSDSFSYTISDGNGGTATATVSITVTEGPGGGTLERAHGSGFLATGSSSSGDDDDDEGGSGKLNFSFDAKFEQDGSLKGKLKVNDKGAGVKIDADQITSLSGGGSACNGVPPSANSFEFTAIGKFNNVNGAQFRVCGEDNGNPGKGNDRIHIQCVSGCSYDSASRTPDDVLDGGNIHLDRAAARAAGRAAEPQVVELDPILLSEAVVGTPQLMVAIVHQDQVNLEGLNLTLSWTRSDGSTGSASAITDALGIGLFQATTSAGATEYIVRSGAVLESNAIEITGTLGF